MAKNINHLQHVKSSVVENGMPKLPAPSVLVEGELAVNYAADYETLSIKNSSGEVVTFSSDNYYSEKKLGSGFTGENSGVTVTQAMNNTEKVVAAALNDLNSRKLDVSAYTESVGDFYTKEEIDGVLGNGFTVSSVTSSITDAFKENELVIAAALNDLDDRKLDASAYTPTDLSDYATKQWVNEERLGSGFTGENSGRTVTQVIEDDELAISAALNDLNDRKLDMSAYTPTDLSNYYDKDEIDDFLYDFGETLNGKVSSITINNSTKTASNGNVNLGTVVSSVTVNGSAVTVSNGVAPLNITATYDSNTKKIYLKNGNDTMSEIDATDFIKDGMVNDVVVDEPVSGSNSGVTCLIVTFNTDAGKEDIEIPLSEMFDSELYYTKEEVNTMLGNDFIDFSGESFSSVTDIIRADETVMAAALNDLNERKLDASAYTPSEFTDLLDEKLGYWFSGDSLSSVTDVIRENEIIVSSALNDLDGRKLDASAYTPTDLSDYATKQWVNEERLGEWFTGDSTNITVTDVIRDDERAISAALNDLDERKLDASAYTETDLSGYYTKQEIDEDKLGSGFTGENSGKTVTQAINETEIVVAAALTDLDDRKLDASAYTQPDLSDYATKEWIENDVLGSGFTGEYSGKSITEVIEENELIISSALNDLDERIIEISGNTGVGIIVSGEYSDGTLYLEKNDGTSIEVSGFTTGGGGGTGDLSGVTFNGVAATKSNGIAAITANVVSSVTMNSTNKSINNGALDLGTVITAETQLSTATTGTGVVVTGLTVSNHKITTNMGNITLDNVADGSTRKLPTALSALTADATHRLVTDTEKTNWNNAANDRHVHGNLSVLEGITSQKVTNWDNAYTSAHSHSNKSVLDGIDATKVGNWDNAATNAHSHDNKAVLDSLSASVITNSHTHSNKGVLDNLTQAVIDNSHTHSNRTVLDGITTAKTAQWDNAISAVSFNGTDATVTNHKAAITATIPTSLSQLTSAHTHAISEVTNLQSTLNAKVSGITVNNGTKVTPTNGVANLTINASTVGALASGTTLDGIADGTTRKLSDYATTGTVNTHSGTTIPSATSSQMHLPTVTAADNGKILMVSGGTWVLVSPTTIYTGTGTPNQNQGNDGDIYLQTS